MVSSIPNTRVPPGAYTYTFHARVPSQLVVPPDKKRADPDNASLVEVGPRCCLNPIKVRPSVFDKCMT